MTAIRRGFLYWAIIDKRRPVLVLSPDYRNQHARDVIIVPLSTRMRVAPQHVALRKGEGGLAHVSMIKCEQPTTIPRDAVTSLEPLGPPLSATRMAEVELAVLRSIGVAI